MLKVQNNSPLDRYDWVPAQLASALQQTQSKRVADIGAGDGCMRAAIEAAGGEWFGFDLEPQLPEISECFKHISMLIMRITPDKSLQTLKSPKNSNLS